MKNANAKSPIFGLQYLEEEEATKLDIVGCQGLATDPTNDDPPEDGVTLRSCGDWDTNLTLDGQG